MPLLYSAVVKGKDILVEYNQSTKHVATSAAYQIRNVRQNWGKHTVNSEGYNYHFLFNGELAFMTVTEDSLNRSIPTGFLNRIRDEFVQKYGDKTSGSCKSFSSNMKQAMNHCNEHPEEFCKVAAVQKKVDEVKNVMEHNINQVLERGEKLTVMVQKADDLKYQAASFERHGKEVRSQQCCAMWRVYVITFAALLVLGIIIASLICANGDNCRPRRHSRFRSPSYYLNVTGNFTALP